MDLLQLQYFCTIAQYENITRAAKALFVSQPNLSTSLSRLEDDLGVKLFERRRGKVSLTPNGQLFLSYAERVLNELNAGVDAVKAAQRASHDQLRVVGSQMDFVVEVLRSYFSTDSTIKIRQVNCANLDVYDRVLSDDADFGFFYGKPKTRILEYAPLLTSERIAIVRNDHPLAAKKVISVKELDGEPLICNYSRDDSEFLDELGRTYGFQPSIMFECDNTQIESALLGNGQGISLTPLPCYYRYKELNPALPISYVRFQELLPPSQMGIVRRPGVRLTASALTFLQKVAEYFSLDRARMLEQYPWELSDTFWHVEFDGKTE